MPTTSRRGAESGEGDGLVGGPDWADHGTDSWTRPDSAAHPDVLAAIVAIRAGLRALMRERQAASLPSPRGLRLAEGDDRDDPNAPDALDEVLDGLSLLTLGQRARVAWSAAVPVVLPPRAPDSPLARARDGLGLTPFEVGVLALALAAAVVDLGGHLVTLLHDDDTLEQRRPTVELALALLAPGDPRDLTPLTRLVTGSPLYTWGLLRPDGAGDGRAPWDADAARPRGGPAVALRQPLALEAAPLRDLLGALPPHPSLAALARLGDAGAPPDSSALPPALAALVDLADPHDPAARSMAVAPLALLVVGTDAHACLGAAEATAARLGRPLLLIDGARLAGLDDGVGALRRLLVTAALRDWLPCVRDVAPLLAAGAPFAEAVRGLLRTYRRPVLLLGGADAPLGDGIARVEAPPPRMADRIAQWRRAADVYGIAADDDTVRALAETSGLSGPAITEVALATVAEATARRGLARGTDLQRAARASVRARATTLTLSEPRATWADLVLPADRLRLLRRLCARVRYRSRVREDWAVGASTLPGVTALFSGVPGTGKSLAAEVVAHDVGLALCKIDLSQTVSKYIGETEKALGRLFDEAERGGVLLVFDEADALFGKRSAVKDSHDRYANLETSYLLQRLERFSGLAILTTNLGANLDEAFTRRISVGVDFPLPGPNERMLLWLRALAGAPYARELNLPFLAERLALSGGEILNVVVVASYLAAEEGGEIDTERVAEALRGELSKMGRLIDPHLLQPATPSPSGPTPARSTPPPTPARSTPPPTPAPPLTPAALSLPARPDPAAGTERTEDASGAVTPGLRRGGSRATEGVRGPRPAERRPGA